MRYIKKYTMQEWNRFDIDIQEILCKKYNIRIVDFMTKEQIINRFENQYRHLVGESQRKSRERKIQMLKKTGRIMGELGSASLQMIQAFSSQPAPKKRRKRRK